MCYDVENCVRTECCRERASDGSEVATSGTCGQYQNTAEHRNCGLIDNPDQPGSKVQTYFDPSALCQDYFNCTNDECCIPGDPPDPNTFNCDNSEPDLTGAFMEPLPPDSCDGSELIFDSDGVTVISHGVCDAATCIPGYEWEVDETGGRSPTGAGSISCRSDGTYQVIPCSNPLQELGDRCIEWVYRGNGDLHMCDTESNKKFNYVGHCRVFDDCSTSECCMDRDQGGSDICGAWLSRNPTIDNQNICDSEISKRFNFRGICNDGDNCSPDDCCVLRTAAEESSPGTCGDFLNHYRGQYSTMLEDGIFPCPSGTSVNRNAQCADMYNCKLNECCEIDTDDCSPNPCLNGGSCSDNVHSHTCTCVDGYHGDNCEAEVVDYDCNPDPCQNGGACVYHDDRSGNPVECICPEGFEGARCENPVGSPPPPPSCSSLLRAEDCGRAECFWNDSTCNEMPSTPPSCPEYQEEIGCSSAGCVWDMTSCEDAPSWDGWTLGGEGQDCNEVCSVYNNGIDEGVCVGTDTNVDWGIEDSNDLSSISINYGSGMSNCESNQERMVDGRGRLTPYMIPGNNTCYYLSRPNWENYSPANPLPPFTNKCDNIGQDGAVISGADSIRRICKCEITHG
jgi:hypothetical protein